MDSICLIVCLSWLTGCLLRLYRGTAERDNNVVILCNNYDIVTTFGANTRTCFYLCHVDYYVLVWLFVVQVHDSLFQQVSLELSYLIDLLILAVLAGLLRHLRQLIYFRIYWCTHQSFSYIYVPASTYEGMQMNSQKRALQLRPAFGFVRVTADRAGRTY